MINKVVCGDIMKHYTREEIVAYIDGKLTQEQMSEIKKHISECDKCYLNYATLKSAYLEIEDAVISTIPEKVYKSAETELGLNEVADKPNKIIEKRSSVLQFFDKLFNPRIIVPVAAVLLVIFGYITFKPHDTFKKPIKDIDSEVNQPFKSNDLVRGKLKMPDLEGIPEDMIIEILEKMEVEYEIRYVEDGFKQIPGAGSIITKIDTVHIFLLKSD